MTDLDELWRVVSGDAVTDVVRPGWREPDGAGPVTACPWPVTVYLRLASARFLRLDQVKYHPRVSARMVSAATVPAELDPDDEFVLISVGDLLLPSAPAVVTGLRAVLDGDGQAACLELVLRGGRLLVDPWSFDGLELSAANLAAWRRRMHAENLAGLRQCEWSAGAEQVPPQQG